MNAALFPTLLLGFLLGTRHALDADHVVAVTAIASRQGRWRDAVRIGVLWGLGHTVTILLVGGAIILLHLIVPPRLGLAMEFLVALMLIGLGARNLTGAGGGPPAALAAFRPVVVGVVHGLAGSAAIALLVLAALPDPGWAMGYLLLFGVGTVLGMMGVTILMAVPLSLGGARFGWWGRALQLTTGTLSVSIGLVLATRIAVLDGLFVAAPLWMSR